MAKTVHQMIDLTYSVWAKSQSTSRWADGNVEGCEVKLVHLICRLSHHFPQVADLVPVPQWMAKGGLTRALSEDVSVVHCLSLCMSHHCGSK